MESIFSPVPINPVNMEPSNIIEKWPRFKIIFYINFEINFQLVPCILFSVNVKPTNVLKLLCYHLNLTREHVTNIPPVPKPVLPKV